MADEDQRFRRERSANAPWDPSVDQRNTRRMREIVSAFGWPTLSKVGADAEHKAWLLVQHADLEFQRECFALMALEPANEDARNTSPTSKIGSECARAGRSDTARSSRSAVKPGSRCPSTIRKVLTRAVRRSVSSRSPTTWTARGGRWASCARMRTSESCMPECRRFRCSRSSTGGSARSAPRPAASSCRRAERGAGVSPVLGTAPR